MTFTAAALCLVALSVALFAWALVESWSGDTARATRFRDLSRLALAGAALMTLQALKG